MHVAMVTLLLSVGLMCTILRVACTCSAGIMRVVVDDTRVGITHTCMLYIYVVGSFNSLCYCCVDMIYRCRVFDGVVI